MPVELPGDAVEWLESVFKKRFEEKCGRELSPQRLEEAYLNSEGPITILTSLDKEQVIGIVAATAQRNFGMIGREPYEHYSSLRKTGEALLRDAEVSFRPGENGAPSRVEILARGEEIQARMDKIVWENLLKIFNSPSATEMNAFDHFVENPLWPGETIIKLKGKSSVTKRAFRDWRAEIKSPFRLVRKNKLRGFRVDDELRRKVENGDALVFKAKKAKGARLVVGVERDKIVVTTVLSKASFREALKTFAERIIAYGINVITLPNFQTLFSQIDRVMADHARSKKRAHTSHEAVLTQAYRNLGFSKTEARKVAGETIANKNYLKGLLFLKGGGGL